MTMTLRPEQEMLLLEIVNSGRALSIEDALDQAFDMLRQSLGSAMAVRRLANFGKRHGLSLGGMTIKELLRESRP
jgi:hypothetical protein